MSIYTGIIISDIHVGAFSLERIKKEYDEIFIDYISKMDKLDFLIVCGDFFDHKFYLNDKESIIAHIMLKELVEVCKEKNTALRFVYGTESHECNQYDIFSLLKIYDNIKIIKYVEEEELLEGLDVLYIPEEHILNKDSYYDKYFSNYKKYNYIFGHGVIREVTTDIAVTIENRKTQNKSRKEVPVFSSSELMYCCKGKVYFGHYHINKDIDDDIFSIGSFSRWKFGEEERKGFYEVTCNTKKNKYTNTYIENQMADTFKTISYGFNSKLFKDDSSRTEILNGIKNMADSDTYNHVRYIFNVPDTVENPESILNQINEQFKYSNNIKTEIVNGYVEKRKEQKKEQIKQDNDKYSFIFDRNIGIEEKTSKFIEIEYNKKISADEISKYLTMSVNELIK